MRIYIDTLGCKLNQAESEEIGRNFVQAGARMASSIEEADLYVLNTCSVTREAERKARQFLRKARTLNREAKICAAGCYAKRSPADIRQLEGVSILHNVASEAAVSGIPDPFPETTMTRLPHGRLPRTRSMLKIQEGCNYTCTYCVVPAIRGRERSLPPDQIINAVKTREKEGYREVVLTGTRVGSYNHNGQNLRELISEILSETSIERVRLSSLQPREISEDLLALWNDRRLCPHFHIPLQSGSDHILQKMGRRYLTSDYARCITGLRGQVRGASITTDIIVGFPAEGDKEFRQSLAFCHDLSFTKIHVFPFSPRAGTPAAIKPGQVDIKLKKARSALMLELSRLSQLSHLAGYAGRTCSVLWEKEVEKGLWSGLSESYVRVYCHSNENLRNSIISVRIKGSFREGVAGEII